MPSHLEVFGPSPLKIFQIIGVVDDPAAVGIFVVDFYFQYVTVLYLKFAVRLQLFMSLFGVRFFASLPEFFRIVAGATSG